MLILPLPGNGALARDLAERLDAELGVLESRQFPDGESYIRLVSKVAGREVVLVCTLARPDDQFLRLAFTARTAREQGASMLTLVAPYLAYMRQDKAFHDGEAITSNQFAHLLSAQVDRLVTVDPHLHRHKALAEIYGISAVALQAAPLLSDWIKRNVDDPLIIGPDAESDQWATSIAAGAPAVVLRKTRNGDRDVTIEFPDLSLWKGRQPVLVDDIASSGRTLIEACKGLATRGFAKPICVVIHPLFAGDSFKALSGVAGRVVSTDTVPHETNAISVVELLAQCLAQ